MTEQGLLFTPTHHGNWRVAENEKPAPAQQSSSSSRAGARHIERANRSNLRTLILRVLHSRGQHGATIEELAEAVSELRGKPTKESTICGRVAGSDAELSEWVAKSGKRRLSKAGVPVDVYVHKLHAGGAQ